ncbi:MAG: hypothetical protein EZS28_023341 [Streblomastix strix]|uniref:Uncharacterized protein n=1 Tax=Streblomastix strix TaxID=222440 RepID=A0A5J4VEU3_9EUKA|nr:MAG: hypothetical protein EZS28_023341 [Streblomastix strix]
MIMTEQGSKVTLHKICSVIQYIVLTGKQLVIVFEIKQAKIQQFLSVWFLESILFHYGQNFPAKPESDFSTFFVDTDLETFGIYEIIAQLYVAICIIIKTSQKLFGIQDIQTFFV